MSHIVGIVDTIPPGWYHIRLFSLCHLLFYCFIWFLFRYKNCLYLTLYSLFMIHSNPTLQKKLLLAIKKSQWTLENVTKMIEANEACGDIGQQLSSAIGLLRTASIDLMKNHLICCGTAALSHKNPKKSHEFVEEFARIWDVSTRK